MELENKVEMVKCKSCGKEIEKKFIRCAHCGADQRSFFSKHKFLLIAAVVVMIIAIGASLGGNKDTETPVVNNNDTTVISNNDETTENVTINSLAEKQSAFVGEINKIYRVDTAYKNDDGSYMMINVQSVKKYASFKANNGSAVKNVIVLENVLPISETQNYVSKVASFNAFDEYGNTVDVGDIYTQTGKENSEIVINVANIEKCKYVLVGGLDEAANGKRSIVFNVK